MSVFKHKPKEQYCYFQLGTRRLYSGNKNMNKRAKVSETKESLSEATTEDRREWRDRSGSPHRGSRLKRNMTVCVTCIVQHPNTVSKPCTKIFHGID